MWVGWGRWVDSIRIQIGKRNQIYLCKHKLTKIWDNWLALTIQASQANLFRENVLLGGRLINSLFSQAKRALAQPAYNSCNSLPLVTGWSEVGGESGGEGGPSMGFVRL